MTITPLNIITAYIVSATIPPWQNANTHRGEWSIIACTRLKINDVHHWNWPFSRLLLYTHANRRFFFLSFPILFLKFSNTCLTSIRITPWSRFARCHEHAISNWFSFGVNYLWRAIYCKKCTKITEMITKIIFFFTWIDSLTCELRDASKNT